MKPLRSDSTPRFWRSAALPFIEARSIADGRSVCYGRHSHETFSIGAIIGGRSTCLHGNKTRNVETGSIVIFNPEEVHACNPSGDSAWSYRMIYVDTSWLGALQHDLGFGRNRDFHTFSTPVTEDSALFGAYERFYHTLVFTHGDDLQKQCAAVLFFDEIHRRLNPSPAAEEGSPDALVRAADYIAGNCTLPLKIEDICDAAQLSSSYLIRAFRKRYGMTPHAWMIDRRIRYARAQLRRGRPLVEVALDAGFADQAHFQRCFKRFVAATPQQYRITSA